ncbi:MAG: hypothetical protein COA70_02635 [Planctomycetota bacterium]|nr:MAG: hypothetical protein COA70_02635 [Planctomycetota bacterium]
MRFLLPLITLLLLGSPAFGQIYALEFKDQKYAKGYKKNIYQWNGRKVVLVEIRGGIGRSETGFTWKPNDRLEFFVQNQSDPLDLAYKIDNDGMRKTKKKSLTIGISGDRVKGLSAFMRNESFLTLSLEYQRRLDLMNRLRDKRADAEEGSAAWFAPHDQLIRELDLLKLWLNQTGFFKAANKLERDIYKEKKRSKEAKTARLDSAIASIKIVKVDPKLTEAAHKIGGPSLEFHSQESKHLKFVYHTGISDDQITRLAELGETVIDGFRTQFVDPYLSEKFKDHIPDDLFLEFFFSTDQQMHYEKIYEDYLGGSWGSGDNRRRRLNIHGASVMQGKLFISYWLVDERADLEGMVVHQLGHRLAERNYQTRGNLQDWLEEGLGYFLSFNFLNRNSVNCVAFKPPPRAVLGETVASGGKKKKKKKEDRTVAIMKGLRDVMAGVAFHSKMPTPRLLPKQQYDFENEDTAKAWAFFSFLADEKGRAGQEWLRGLTLIVDEDDFQLLLQDHTKKWFGYEGGSPVETMEEEWKAYMLKNFDV